MGYGAPSASVVAATAGSRGEADLGRWVSGWGQARGRLLVRPIILEPERRPDSALWRPFASMADPSQDVLEVVRGEGVWVWDSAGSRYLDGSSSLWYANVGHGRAEISRAIMAQLSRLETFHIFGAFTNRPAELLAERISSMSPAVGSKVFLTSGGGDSIETAVKLARLFHAVRGEPSRRYVISRTHGYHGTHGIGTSILGMPYWEEFGPLVETTRRIPWDSLGALKAEINALGSENIAAFVFEPVIGSGGVRIPPEGYLESVCRICYEHGIVTIADAVIGGFGRLGNWLAVERWGLQPDLIVFAKGVTSGYLPLGGVVVSPTVAEPFYENPETLFAHGATYSGHATCCAAALANLDLLATDGLVFRAAELEKPFHERLRTLETHPLVSEVRGGVGLMAAVALRQDALETFPDIARDFWLAARGAGVLTRALVDGVAVAPPLIVTDADQEFITDRLAHALHQISSKTAAWPRRAPDVTKA